MNNSSIHNIGGCHKSHVINNQIKVQLPATPGVQQRENSLGASVSEELS